MKRVIKQRTNGVLPYCNLGRDREYSTLDLDNFKCQVIENRKFVARFSVWNYVNEFKKCFENIKKLCHAKKSWCGKELKRDLFDFFFSQINS
jgi:hypothetical protein